MKGQIAKRTIKKIKQSGNWMEFWFEDGALPGCVRGVDGGHLDASSKAWKLSAAIENAGLGKLIRQNGLNGHVGMEVTFKHDGHNWEIQSISNKVGKLVGCVLPVDIREGCLSVGELEIELEHTRARRNDALVIIEEKRDKVYAYMSLLKQANKKIDLLWEQFGDDERDLITENLELQKRCEELEAKLAVK